MHSREHVGTGLLLLPPILHPGKMLLFSIAASYAQMASHYRLGMAAKAVYLKRCMNKSVFRTPFLR